MGMRFLITGGAGFIGSAVIRHLLANTVHVVANVDKLTYAGNLDSLAAVACAEHYSFHQLDICNQEAITKLLLELQPDVVMHLATESHVDRLMDGPQTSSRRILSVLIACWKLPGAIQYSQRGSAKTTTTGLALE